MNCPRCGLSMKAEKYEKQPVRHCTTCWGYWTEPAPLRNILRNQIEKFSAGERRSVFQAWASHGDVDRQGREREAIDCPVCRARMSKRTFHPECPVVVDQCPKHGIWLDTGEIKELQIFVESRKEPLGD